MRKLIGTIALVGAVLLEAHSASALDVQPDSTGQVVGNVYAFASSEGILYVGGKFSKIEDSRGKVVATAANVAAFDELTGAPIASFHPRFTANGTTAQVRALDVQDGFLYVGGRFTECDGHGNCRNLARVDLGTGTVDHGFHPQVGNVGASVHAILADGDVYLGGSFRSINGKPRQRAGAVDSSGVVTAWDPNSDDVVRSLTLDPDGSHIWLSGHFATLNKVAHRQSIAEVDLSHGTVTPWDATSKIETEMTCWDLAIDSSAVYAGCGQKHNFYAAFAYDTADQLWRKPAGGNVESVSLTGAGLFIGGHFGTRDPNTMPCGGNYLRGIALVNPSNGNPDCSFDPSWIPDTHNYTGGWALLTVGTHLWAGGKLTDIGSQKQHGFARWSL